MKKLFLVILVIMFTTWWYQDPTIEAEQSGIAFDYAVKYPADVAADKTLPMLIALHGNGDTPEHFFETALSDINIPTRVILLEAPISMGRGSAWPMDHPELQRYADAIAEVVPRLLEKYPGRNKPVLLGFSGGGVMAYYLAASHPEAFSYIVPISGRLTHNQLATLPNKQYPPVRVVAFHGIQDALINISGGRLASQLLRERGVDIQLREFQGGHLGVFTNMKPEITQLLNEKLKLLLYGV